jgi:hypothetical protein
MMNVSTRNPAHIKPPSNLNSEVLSTHGSEEPLDSSVPLAKTA